MSAYAAVVEDKTNSSSCDLCKESHFSSRCPKFRGWSVAKRRGHVQRKRLCYNCLRAGHTIHSCPSLSRCQKCQGQHYTLIYTGAGKTPSNTTKSANSTVKPEPTVDATTPVASNLVTVPSAALSSVRLATARICLENENGHRVILRTLLDSGAQDNFVSERMVQQLKLRKRKVMIPLIGLQNTCTGTATHEVSVLLRSHDFTATVTLPRVWVLLSLTALHTVETVKTTWPH